MNRRSLPGNYTCTWCAVQWAYGQFLPRDAILSVVHAVVVHVSVRPSVRSSENNAT